MSNLLTNIASLDEKKKGNPNLMYFFGADHQRLQLDKRRIMGAFPQIKKVLCLLDFDKISLGTNPITLTKGYIVSHYANNKATYTDVAPNQIQPSKYHTAVLFTNMILPSERLILSENLFNLSKFVVSSFSLLYRYIYNIGKIH